MARVYVREVESCFDCPGNVMGRCEELGRRLVGVEVPDDCPLEEGYRDIGISLRGDYGLR